MKNSQNEIEIKAAQIVIEQLKLDDNEVDWNKSFIELGADSLDLVELVIRFEDTFKVMIDDAAAVRLHRLADVVGYLS